MTMSAQNLATTFGDQAGDIRSIMQPGSKHLLTKKTVLAKKQRLTAGENIEVVWPTFSTISFVVLFQKNLTVEQGHGHF